MFVIIVMKYKIDITQEGFIHSYTFIIPFFPGILKAELRSSQ